VCCSQDRGGVDKADRCDCRKEGRGQVVRISIPGWKDGSDETQQQEREQGERQDVLVMREGMSHKGVKRQDGIQGESMLHCRCNDGGLLQRHRTQLLCCDDDITWSNMGKMFHRITTRTTVTSFFRCRAGGF